MSHVRSTSTNTELTAHGAQERGGDALVELRPGAALELGLGGLRGRSQDGSVDAVARSGFSTTRQGLRRDEPAMRLYEKAKRLGVWNPAEIDLDRHVRDWDGLEDDERDLRCT